MSKRESDRSMSIVIAVVTLVLVSFVLVVFVALCGVAVYLFLPRGGDIQPREPAVVPIRRRAETHPTESTPEHHENRLASNAPADSPSQHGSVVRVADSIGIMRAQSSRKHGEALRRPERLVATQTPLSERRR